MMIHLTQVSVDEFFYSKYGRRNIVNKFCHQNVPYSGSVYSVSVECNQLNSKKIEKKKCMAHDTLIPTKFHKIN